ncbi:MAG: type II secretion system protein N [Shewanella sp.]|nr:type II secretion system protein N [Shewanella sp.]MCF1430548.1 type II secretion system protein N [Shewanella sp.]MCF1437648.1 type II secretion system protein N [Shewanella sp.]MCF1459152.1 type II secretion system protein N [Shewanella sp.]
MFVVKKIFLGLLIYLVFMLALFPARVAVQLVPLPPQVKIAGVSGTIWDGIAGIVSLDKRMLEQVHWQLKFLPLLTGKVTVDLAVGSRATVVSGKGLLSWSLSGVQAQDLRFEAPANFVIGDARLPFHTKVDGEVSVIVPQLQQGKPWCNALDGKVFLNKLNVTNQFGDYPLGNIHLALACRNGELVLSTDEKSNGLGVQGEFTIGENNKLLVDAKVRETPEQPKDLKQALGFLGKPDSEGYYPIRYSGVVPGL